MTTPDRALTTLATLISVLGLWVLISWLVRDYRVDAFRQRMYELRDELFDLADSGLISFSHPAYTMLRSTMNGFICFARDFGPIQSLVLLLFFWSIRSQSDGFDDEWYQKVRALPAATSLRLHILRRRMDFLMLGRMAPGLEPLAWFLLRMLTRAGASERLEPARRAVQSIDKVAFTVGRGAGAAAA